MFSGGIEALLKELPVWVKGSELQRLGIVVDSDADLVARWQSVQNVLLTSGYTTIPVEPKRDGTVLVAPNLPVVGIWLMPDNTQPGMLEDLARQLIASSDQLWDRVEACINMIPYDERRWRSSYLIKAQLHTWLAWQEEPGSPIGQALTKRFLDADAPQVQPLLASIRRLFEV